MRLLQNFILLLNVVFQTQSFEDKILFPVSIFNQSSVISQLNRNKFSLLKSCLNFGGVNTESRLVKRNNSTEYTDLNFQWNKCCVGEIKPLAYMLAKKVTDVQTAVFCSRLLGIRIVPKGGGHSYGKYSFGDSNSLIVDLRDMDDIIVDKSRKVASIGPGVIMGPLLYKLYQEGEFGIPFGQCPPVGISFGMGGGYGDFSRLHGMATDSLLEVEMVDANGHVLRANKLQNSDLFWALSGGGSGSFGIVTNFKYRLFNTPKSVVLGFSLYDINSFPQVQEAWENFLLTNPSNSINALLRIFPAPSTTIYLQLIHLQTQEESDTIGTTEIQRILTELFPNPIEPSKIETFDYLHFVVKSGNEETGFNINITDPAELQNVSRHDFAPKGTLRAKTFYVPTATVGTYNRSQLLTMLQTRPKNIIIIIRASGGKIAEVGPTETAFIHRGQNLYEVDVLYIGSIEDTELALIWMRQYFNLTKKLMKHTESYQNHLDIELTDYLKRYYGTNVQKLISVKQKYDPTNVFNNPQSIPVWNFG